MYLFDVCHTLYNSNTTMDFIDFFHYINKTKVWCLPSFFFKRKIIKMVNALFFKVTKRDLIRFFAVSKLKGYSKRELYKSAQMFISSLPKIPEVHKILEDAKKKGQKIMLASASLDFIVQAIANELSVEVLCASKMEWKNNICQGRIKEDMLGRKNLFIPMSILNNSIVVTDNLTDCNLIKHANHSYVVAKPRRLKLWKKKICNMEKVTIIEFHG